MQDVEDRTSNKADEIAEQRYGREFNGLPPQLQMTVWMEAEQAVASDLASERDAIYDRMREDGVTHWDELEVMRRQGK